MVEEQGADDAQNMPGACPPRPDRACRLCFLSLVSCSILSYVHCANSFLNYPRSSLRERPTTHLLTVPLIEHKEQLCELRPGTDTVTVAVQSTLLRATPETGGAAHNNLY